MLAIGNNGHGLAIDIEAGRFLCRGIYPDFNLGRVGVYETLELQLVQL